MSKIYLGDGAYAEIDSLGNLELTTSDGYTDTNTIILEPQPLDALLRFITQQFDLTITKNPPTHQPTNPDQ